MADAPLGGKTTFNEFPRGVSDGKTHLNTSENLPRLQRVKHFIQRHTRNQPNHPSYSSVTLFGYHDNRRRLKKPQLRDFSETSLGASSSWRLVTEEHWSGSRTARVAVVQGKQLLREYLRGKLIDFPQLSRQFDLEFALVFEVLLMHEASSEVHPELSATHTTATLYARLHSTLAMSRACPCTGPPPRLYLWVTGV